MDAIVYGNLDDDAELEAELLALEAEEAGAQLLNSHRKVAQNHRQARSAGGSPFTEESKSRKGPKTMVEIEKFASNLDEDLVLDDEDFDENDPELLVFLASLNLNIDFYHLFSGRA